MGMHECIYHLACALAEHARLFYLAPLFCGWHFKVRAHPQPARVRLHIVIAPPYTIQTLVCLLAALALIQLPFFLGMYHSGLLMYQHHPTASSSAREASTITRGAFKKSKLACVDSVRLLLEPSTPFPFARSLS